VIAARALEDAFGAHAVSALALFSADRDVYHRGFGDDVSALGEVAATLRHVFRETSPVVDTIDLRFETARLLAMLLDESVLVVRVPDDLVPDALMTIARRHLAERAAAASSPLAGEAEAAGEERAAPTPSTSPEPAALTLAIEALGRVTTHARTSLGGPVIRNYLRRARAALGEPASLRVFDVDLKGEVRASVETADDEVVTDAGQWCGEFLRQVAAIAPELARSDLRALMGPLAATLASRGFFGAQTNGRSQ
jgi:hypothetical protein